MAVVAIGFSGFARLERSWNVAFVAAGMLAVTAVVASANVRHACRVLSATCGAPSPFTGISLRQGRRRLDNTVHQRARLWEVVRNLRAWVRPSS